MLTKSCNLKCSYCYEKHDQRDQNEMHFYEAIGAVEKYLSFEDDFDYILIDFFGGEPLLAFPLIKKIVEWCQTNNWVKKYHFMVSTNATLLNEEMKDWFFCQRERITLGLSLDGNREAHNKNRDNSYDIIAPHIDFFIKNWPNQPVKMTVSAETIPLLADSVIELEEKGIFFTANLPFENIWDTPDNKKRLLEVYETQLLLLVDYYSKNHDLYPVYPLLGGLPTYLGLPELNIVNHNDCVRYCGAGHEMVVIDTDGVEYPCHRFLPWVTGKTAPGYPVNRQTSWEPVECQNCMLVHSCPTCAGYNWEINGNSGIRTTFHCEAHKLEVKATAKIASHRLEKIPASQVAKMSIEEKNKMGDVVRTLLKLNQIEF